MILSGVRSLLATFRRIASASSAGWSASSFRAVSMNRRDCSGLSALRGGEGLRVGMKAP